MTENTGMTPGRTAQEASARILRERFGDIVKPWDEVSAETRGGWDDIAQAVLNDAFPGLRQQIADLRSERDEARAEAARLRGLLAEAVNPSAQDYDHAAEILRLREQLAAQAGFTENPACDAHRWYAVVTHCGSFAYGFSATSDGLRVWDDADEFEHAKARDFE